MRLALVHIPKTAGASIAKWFQTNKIIYQPAVHLTLQECKDVDTSFECDKSFTVVRNTYSRMLSLYNFGKYKIPKSIWRARKANDFDLINNYYNPMQAAWDKGIVYYIDYAVDNNLRSVMCQTKFIEDVEILLKFENLNNEFTKVQELVNCNAPLTQQLHKYKEKTVTEYSEDYINCIKRHFQKDLDFFKYVP